MVPHARGLALEGLARQAGEEMVWCVQHCSAWSPGKADLTLHSFPAALGLGHCHIHRAPGLPAILRAFLGGLEGQEERASRLA